jgi:hypothetical protein
MMLGLMGRVAGPALREGSRQRRRVAHVELEDVPRIRRAAVFLFLDGFAGGRGLPIYGWSVGGSRLTPSTQTSSSSPVSGL